MTVELPESLKVILEEEVARGGYGAPGEYLAALVLAERKRRAEDALESELLRGLDSGPPVTMDAEWWRRFNNPGSERW